MEIISRKEAKEKGLLHYFTGIPCIHGHIARRRVNDRNCAECDKLHKTLYRYRHPERSKEIKKVGYYKYRDRHLATRKKYVQNNKAKVNALAKAYKVRKKNRIPIWVDKNHMWLIKEVYELAQIRTKESGYSWHVDHIIPLQGELVSGLHVIENLQVIPGIENIKKKNKYEIDNAE
jgi:hypothetical protein